MINFSVFSSIKLLLGSKRVKQTGILYLSLVISLVLGILVSVINTRLLGVKAFGDFKFLQTIWILGVTFVTFGLFATGSNLLARRTSLDTERPLAGSLLVIAGVIAVLFTLVIAIASFPIGYLYGQELGGKLRLFSALVFVFPLQLYLQEVLRGTNAITNLALLNALPQLLYIPAALATKHYIEFSLDIALLLFLLSIAITVLLVTLLTKPRFNKPGSGIKEILAHNRSIGLNVYLAVLVTTATTQLSQFSLAYFFDTRLVGIFSLAITITMPLTMIPNAIATSFFKQFASLTQIPRKVIIMTLAISTLTLLGFLAVIDKIIVLLYSQQFIEVVPLAYICAAGALIHGMGDVYNRFLLAHGRTKELRNNAMFLGVLSVVGYIFLVIKWGVMGAAITKIMVDIFYLLSMFEYYHHHRKHLNSQLISS